jgi:DNA polymerase-1
MDLHLFTAARMFGRDAAEITKDQRTAAKSINFGILFGIGPAALAEGITNDTGVFCSVETARRFLQMYGKTYPRLMDFLKRLGESARHEMETYTALGHRRRFVQPRRPSRADYQTQEDYDDAVDEYRGALSGIEREGKNTPIQGTAACIAKQAILDLERVLGEYGAGIVAFVHDEIVVECPDLMADEVARVLKGTMEAAGRRFMKAVPCVAEVECGLNWLGEGFEEAA